MRFQEDLSLGEVQGLLHEDLAPFCGPGRARMDLGAGCFRHARWMKTGAKSMVSCLNFQCF